MKLRKYQKEDFKVLKKSPHQHQLFGAATGYGKSAIIFNLVKREIKKGGRVLIIAPRRKLVKQLADTVEAFYPSVIMGTDTVYDKECDVFVASTATLHRRLEKHKRSYLGNITLVLIDEVHINFGAASMQNVVDLYWNKARWVGLSATPVDAAGYRLEGWDDTYYKHQTKDLIKMGWLTEPKVMVAETPEGLENVDIVGGEFNESQLGELMGEDARVKNLYTLWNKYATDRKTMIFAVNIAHANIIYEDFISHGVATAIVHSDLDETDEEESLVDFKKGNVNVLINVGKLTVGFDETSVDALIIARPTQSLRLFLQIIGRGLRIHKGKEDCLIIDIAGTVEKHGYPTMQRDFNRKRPARSEREDPEYKDLECLDCGYETQMRNCRKETYETADYITKTWYCPNCEGIMKETVEETKEIERLKLVADYTNTDKVRNEDIERFIHELASAKGYKDGWVWHVAKEYRESPEYRETIKLIYNKYTAGMASLETSVRNICKLRYL